MNDPTIRSVFDTLTKEQKDSVYLIVDRIMEANSAIDPSTIDLSFLSDLLQVIVVRYIIEMAIVDCRKEVEE